MRGDQFLSPQPEPSPALLEDAFTLLLDVVRDFRARDRRPLAATVKAAMVQRTYGGFVEWRLGFRNFGQFLRAAQDRGLVALRAGANQNEILIVPAGEGQVTVELPAGGSKAEQHKPVRSDPRAASPVPSDLWKAFVDWTPGLRRVYRRVSRHALMFPAEEIPMEQPDHTAARQDWLEHPDEYVEITPISQDTHLAWMHAFARSVHDPAARAALEAALASSRPLGAFSTTVRAPILWNEWRTFRLERVVEVIRQWAADHDLEDPLRIEQPVVVSSAALAPTTDSAKGDSPSDRALRAKVVHAVERMPIGDLKRLAIPVEFLEL